MIKLKRLDHLVLTVRDVEATCKFYTDVLGMEAFTFAGGSRKALRFGQQRINLFEHGKETNPCALHPVPGSADLCFITETPLEQVMEHLQRCQIEVEEGPVVRTGATGRIHSVYFRDPDGNLLEVSNLL